MKNITTLEHLTSHFASLRPKRRVATVCPHDQHTMQVVDRCLNQGLAHFILICSEPSEWAQSAAKVRPNEVEVITTDSPDSAARIAVEKVRSHEADVVMKGAINTDNLLHAVLNKETGLLPQGRVLTHLTAAQIPSYHKLLFFSDAAVIPTPDLHQLEAMISYDTAILRRLHIDAPKVALIHFTEKVNPKFTYTIFYQQIIRNNTSGIYGADITIEGPMDVKTACDRHSAEIKHIPSLVAGDADLLIFPGLVAANTFYKTISCFAGATMAGIICGADAPIVIPSRADSAESKFYSLALACIAQNRQP